MSEEMGEAAPEEAPAEAPEHDAGATRLVKDSDMGVTGGETPDKPKASKPKAEPEGDEPKPTRHKARLHGGEEKEYSVDELLEHIHSDGRTFKIGDAEKRLTNAEIQQHVELGDGAYTKMREASELRKQITQARERGKKGGADLEWYIREQLGIADPMSWAKKQLYAEYQRDQEVEHLMGTNPPAARARLQEIERGRSEAKAKADETARQTQAQAEAHQRAQAAFNEKVPGVLEAAGLPHNALTSHLFFSIGSKYQEVGQNLPPETVAGMAKAEWLKLLHGHIDGLDDDALMAFLGDKRREKLRKLELGALKKSGKAAKTAEKAAAKAAKPKGEAPTNLADWAERFG